jgi:hypothetical protein
LEAELLGIQEATDAAAKYVHARGANREERLLDLPNHVRDAVELSIHCGVAVALMLAHVHSGHVLHHIVELADHGGSWEDFDEVANAIVDLVPAEGVVEEATRLLGP